MPDRSPFEELSPATWVASNRTSFAVADAFPVSPGHTLVVPKRRISTWWEATDEERLDLVHLVDEVKRRLDVQYQPDGYNVGFNAGAAAGQTVDHLHLHVIPRYAGDVADPRGGVRHVIPEKGNYLAATDGGGGASELFDPAPELAHLLDNRERTVAEFLAVCLGDRRFDRADLVVSFVMHSGVRVIDAGLEDALERGMRVRLLTTDYLSTTEPEALARLLDLSETFQATADIPGSLDVRVFSDAMTSFHPKGYLFWSSATRAGVSTVGSSNLSRSGLRSGIEWNLTTPRTADLVDRFDDLWNDFRSSALTHDWLRDYRTRRAADVQAPRTPLVEEPPSEPTEIAIPRPIQAEALVALKESMTAGHGAGLVVMATGLGKTWLAAFHARELQARTLLFVAHREEILRQSRDVFRTVLPACDAGLLVGDERAVGSSYLFASVQSLGRHLEQLEPERFEMIVVDEFHHAAARTYRQIIEHFRPAFILGLTATPDRLDGADLLALCSDNLVYQCGLAEGIERGELCPFEYWAQRDVADFSPIPWRNGRFDPSSLAAAIETEARAEQEFEAWRERGGERTLGFCCSVSHADFMADYFSARGVRAVAVHSGPTSADRRLAIERLKSGVIDVIFSADLFNEGVDVPTLDTVLMLRPTDSPVIFLQQLGRGLRTAPGKAALRVIDFIGNHRTFLFKPRTLLALGTNAYASATAVIEAMRTGDFGLPPGCSVSYDLAVVEVLAELAAREQGGALAAYCREYHLENGRRPTALQAWRAGVNPAAARQDGWFEVLDSLRLLSEAEEKVVRSLGQVLTRIQKAPITKSYKLVCLQAFSELGGVRGGVELRELAYRSREILRADPRLLVDVGSNLSVDDGEWERYWTRWPASAWAGELAGSSGDPLFRIKGTRFMPAFGVAPEDEEVFASLVAELVDYRLCRYLDQKAGETGNWRLRVGQTNGKPLIWLNREQNAGLPEGDAVIVVDGRRYVASFVKIALNVVRSVDQPSGNDLPELLRQWYGAAAGQPGTAHTVVLRQHDGQLVLEPWYGEQPPDEV